MPKCYCSIFNFAESRRMPTWIFPWFAQEERMRSKTFRRRRKRGVKKMRLRPPLLWSAWPDGSGRRDNRNAAQHLPRDLVRRSSGYKQLAQTTKKVGFSVCGQHFRQKKQVITYLNKLVVFVPPGVCISFQVINFASELGDLSRSALDVLKLVKDLDRFLCDVTNNKHETAHFDDKFRCSESATWSSC